MITVGIFLAICMGLSYSQDVNVHVDGVLSKVQELHSRLLESNIDVAHDTYSSPFIQGMVTNELDPNKYGSYMLQDIVYLKSTRDNLQYLLDNRAVREGKSDPTTAFGKYASDLIGVYDWFYGDLSTSWQLSDVNNIAPSSALKEYVNHQLAAFNDESIPIECTQIILLPCENLWPWLALRMISVGGVDDDQPKKNTYAGWVKSNKEPYFTVTEFVNEHCAHIDFDKARAVHRHGMIAEFNLFNHVLNVNYSNYKNPKPSDA